MAHLQPTVRQLQPLGRPAEPIAQEQADARVPAAETSRPDPVPDGPRPGRPWRRPAARPSPSS